MFEFLSKKKMPNEDRQAGLHRRSYSQGCLRIFFQAIDHFEVAKKKFYSIYEG